MSEALFLESLIGGIVKSATHAARHPTCRMAELNRKRELNAAAELKRAEIILARRYAHQAMLAKFLRTASQPQLLWAPAKHCADTILLEEQRQLELAVWMVRTIGIPVTCFRNSSTSPDHACHGDLPGPPCYEECLPDLTVRHRNFNCIENVLLAMQDKEKARLQENRGKVIDRTKAIIAQAEKMRNAPVAGAPDQSLPCMAGSNP